MLVIGHRKNHIRWGRDRGPDLSKFVSSLFTLALPFRARMNSTKPLGADGAARGSEDRVVTDMCHVQLASVVEGHSLTSQTARHSLVSGKA
jgi:hypothetical protein